MGRYTFDSQGVKEAEQSSPRSKRRSKTCSFCAETIRFEAIKCRFCGEFQYGDRQHSQSKVNAWDDEDAEDCDSTDELQDLLTGEDEQEEDDGVLFRARPSALALLSLIIWTGLILTGCLLILVYPVETLIVKVPNVKVTGPQVEMMVRSLDYAALGSGVFVLLVLLWKVAALKSICYEVTQDRIEWSRGILERKIDNIDMFRVVDLSVRRSLLDCLLGIGSVKVTTKDESDPVFVFEKIRHCHRLYNVIKKSGPEADRKNNVVHLE
jgi:membrane protein YdbS with pleckstrin-like domain